MKRLGKKRKRSEARIGIVRTDGSVLDLGYAFDQVYSFQAQDGEQYHWSVAEARKRAEASGDLGTVSLSEAGMTVEMVRKLYSGLNETYALTTDLTRPLLFVPFKGEHVLIDGWHRVLKAASIGVDILPCYMLSQQDADACLIVRVPLKKGDSGENSEIPTLH